MRVISQLNPKAQASQLKQAYSLKMDASTCQDLAPCNAAPCSIDPLMMVEDDGDVIYVRTVTAQVDEDVIYVRTVKASANDDVVYTYTYSPELIFLGAKNTTRTQYLLEDSDVEMGEESDTNEDDGSEVDSGMDL